MLNAKQTYAGPTNVGQPVAASAPPIIAELDGLKREVEALDKSLTVLVDRLRPALLLDKPPEPSGGAVNKEVETCPLQSEIRAVRNRISTMVAGVHITLNALAL